MARIGVILSGCGVYDGSEIHEAVLTLLALDRAGAEIVMMAPNIEQLHTVNHLNGNEEEGMRNVLRESARIARGKIMPTTNMAAADLDGLIIPGGFGVAKNLSDYAMVGPGSAINPEVMRLTAEFLDAGKPIGAMCIAPTLVARVGQQMGRTLKLTIGNDPATIADLEKMQAVHVECPVDEIVVDEENNLVSTPAYMLGESISQVAVGVDKLVAKTLAMATAG